MLNLTGAFQLRRLDHILVFPDVAAPDTFHCLRLGHRCEKDDGSFSGQLTLFGSGDPDRVTDVQGGFWSMTLNSALTDEERDKLVDALRTEESAPRLIDVVDHKTELTLRLSEIPDISQTRQLEGLGSQSIVFQQNLTSEQAFELRKQWDDRLEDGMIEARITLRGADAPETIGHSHSNATLQWDDDMTTIALHARRESSLFSRTEAGSRQIVHRQPLDISRRDARHSIILVGFNE